MRVVVPSLFYADFLAVTLPAWRQILPSATDVIVVTGPQDRETPKVADLHGVRCVVTDAWTRPAAIMNRDDRPRDVVMNKAAALDEAFGFVPSAIDPPAVSTVCLALDADVWPWLPWPEKAKLEPRTLYGIPRYECQTPALFRQVQSGAIDPRTLALMPTVVKPGRPQPTPAGEARKCLGFFELFQYRSGLRFGSYRDASKYDLDFARQFAAKQWFAGYAVVHLGVRVSGNWQQRRCPPWRAA